MAANLKSGLRLILEGIKVIVMAQADHVLCYKGKFYRKIYTDTVVSKCSKCAFWEDKISCNFLKIYCANAAYLEPAADLNGRYNL